MELSPIIASQSRNICTEVQNYQNCDLVKNMAKMPKMAKTMPHYSSFGLTKRPKKFETILGTSTFSQWFHIEFPNYEKANLYLKSQNNSCMLYECMCI